MRFVVLGFDLNLDGAALVEALLLVTTGIMVEFLEIREDNVALFGFDGIHGRSVAHGARQVATLASLQQLQVLIAQQVNENVLTTIVRRAAILDRSQQELHELLVGQLAPGL